MFEEEFFGKTGPEPYTGEKKKKSVWIGLVCALVVIALIVGIGKGSGTGPNQGDTEGSEGGTHGHGNPLLEETEMETDMPWVEPESVYTYEIPETYVKVNIGIIYEDIPLALYMDSLDVQNTTVIVTEPEPSKDGFEIWMDENEVGSFETFIDVTDRTIQPGDDVIAYMFATRDGREIQPAHQIGEFKVSQLDPVSSVLIGHMVGEEFEQDIHYPVDYNNELLAGQNYHYEIRIESVRTVTGSVEMTEEDAINLGYESLDAYFNKFAGLYSLEQEDKRDIAIRNAINEKFMSTVPDNTVPDWLLEKCEKDARASIMDGYTTEYWPTVDEYLESVFSFTPDTYEQYIDSVTLTAAKSYMITAWVLAGECDYLDIPYGEIADRLSTLYRPILDENGIVDDDDAALRLLRTGIANEELMEAAMDIIMPKLMEYAMEHMTVHTRG